jgi:hypothetical protein
MKKIVFSSMVIFLLSSFGASASFIEGFIQFGGAAWSKDGTEVSVFNPAVGVTTGDFVGQTSVVIADLDYSPFVAIDPLWTTNLGEFSFAIQTLVVVSETADSLSLTGTGLLTSTLLGLDPTLANWSFSAISGPVNFSIATSAVPVPAAVWLFGTAVLGLVGLRRKGKLEVSTA